MMILGIFAYAYMRKFPLYRAMYQQLLSQSTSAINVSMQNITNDTYRKNISNDTGITSDKKGYAYFHDLFIKRHQKLLWYSAKKNSCHYVCDFCYRMCCIDHNTASKRTNQSFTSGISSLFCFHYLFLSFRQICCTGNVSKL